jgi:endonuclease IV
MKIPKTLGAQIDKLHTLRTERLAEEKRIEAMKADEASLREVILAHLAQQRMAKGSGKLATASAVTKVVGKVEDWGKVWDYAKSHDAFDLYQRRLNNKAWLDRLEAGEKIAGVERETVVELSLTKAGA